MFAVQKVCVVVGLALVAACAVQPADLLITDVTVYTGRDEPPFVANVAVKDGAFEAIDKTGRRRFTARQSIEGGGLYMTPGLWDMHVHTADAETGNVDISKFLASGVTSVRDAGGFLNVLNETREALASGAKAGPTLYIVGPTLNGAQHAPFQRVVTTKDEVRSALDDLAAAKVDMVKIHRAFKPDLLPALIEGAHARGLKVIGHIPLGLAPLDACTLGMDGIEHLGSFIEAYASIAPKEKKTSAAAVAYLESDESAPLYKCLAERGVVVTPTLVVYPAVGRALFGDAPPPEDFLEFVNALRRVALRMHGSGVVMMTGSDTSTIGGVDIKPGAALLDELVELQTAGIPPTGIISMATSIPAKTMGVDESTGSIAEGLAADFLLLEADPGADVGNFRKIRTVFQRGEAVASDVSP